MEIIYKKLKELKPYKNNPRKNDEAVDYVAESIKQFGFKVPIIIDRNNEIVAGHTRYKASKKLGIEEVPCIIADDLDEEQIKAFRLADNKVSEYAEWDFDLLNEELSEIFEIEMGDFGFDLNEAEEQQEAIEDEYEPIIPEEPRAKQGDIYQLGNHRVMCGDSTSEEDIEKLLGDEKATLFLSDPPYGISIVSNASKVGGGGMTKFGKVGGGHFVPSSIYKKIKGDETTETAEKNYQIIKNITDNQIIFGGNYFTDFLMPKSCWIVWDKENSGNFADVELAWTSFDKSAKLYKWLWNGMSRKGARDIEGKKRVHPTQKPVGLIGEILKDFSQECDVILDCFGGSGSTLIACEQLNRKCLMMEYEPYYIDIIIDRWEQFTGEKAIKLN